MVAVERPARRMDPYAAQFWEFTKDRELRLQQCSACAGFRWPPSAICDQCLGEEYVWSQVAGEGRALSWVTFQRQYFPEYPAPHRVVMIELDEGPLFISNPVEMEGAELREGMRMRLTWEAAQDRFGDYNLPVFTPSRADKPATAHPEALEGTS